MSNPTDLRYATSHEWAKLDGDVVTVGDYRSSRSSNYRADVPGIAAGRQGTRRRTSRSASSSREVHVRPLRLSRARWSRGTSPSSTTRDERKGDLEPVNDDPFGQGWMVKIELAPGASARPPADRQAVRRTTRAEGTNPIARRVTP